MDTASNLLWLLALVVGGIAAWLDFRTRRVPNELWIYGLALASPLLVAELFTAPLSFLLRIAFAAVFSTALLVLWRAKAFGGADVKGFAFFALVLSPVGYYDAWEGKVYPALDVLVASLLIGELVSRFTKRNAPLFAVSQWPLLLAPVVGGLAWWPLLWLVRLVY